jgi:HD-GYP domain-containing protein (c-di-GMP phosphodiesterase class II)
MPAEVGTRPALDLQERLQRLNQIGVALSVERDLTVLLERILLEARGFTGADAGTLFLVSGDHLTFAIAQNDTLRSFVGGRYGQANIPPVPINRDSVSGYAATTGEMLNIADVYDPVWQRFEGPRNYDRMTGYRTRSMLVVPLRDHEGQIIGVLQLLNAVDPHTGQVGAFAADVVALIQSLASQAAVAITNVRLIRDTEALFDAFVRVMATAIDERSPYTGGHIRRVAEMAQVVAEAVNGCTDGPLADVAFAPDELNELRVASWMHDIGKITTPEWVVDKPTKLTTIHDRIELLRTRYVGFMQAARVQALEQQLAGADPQTVAATCAAETDRLRDELAFLEKANNPGEFMADADLARLQQIAARTYVVDGQPVPSLSADELLNLSIRKGSLTEAERRKISDHANMTIRMLEQIPFTRKLRRVPEIAGAHHEKLDGSGYPQGLRGDQISLQARILALVDIFESLSADDRPYRAEPMTRELVLKILQKEVDAHHLDADLHALFVDRQLYRELDRIKAQMALERQRQS